MFFLIYKPRWISSHTAVTRLKKKLWLSRVGHAGTLDQEAEWLLLIAAEWATPLLNYLVGQDKTYEYTIDLSRTSPSYDLSTDTSAVDCSFPSYQEIEEMITTNFLGKIEQVPPSYSAIWVNGTRAYELILKGKEVNLTSRPIEIYTHEILSYNPPFVRLRARVSSGTYIRSIARDLSIILWTGGVITDLKRTKIGSIEQSYATALEEIELSDQRDIGEFFALRERRIINDAETKLLKNGDISFFSEVKDGYTLLIDQAWNPLSLLAQNSSDSPSCLKSHNSQNTPWLVIIAQLYPREGKRGTIGATRSSLE
jgi:tRNA pseudouridine55 synthase